MSDFWFGVICGALIIGFPLSVLAIVLWRSLPRWEA
jgi:hypothetical protein